MCQKINFHEIDYRSQIFCLKKKPVFSMFPQEIEGKIKFRVLYIIQSPYFITTHFLHNSQKFQTNKKNETIFRQKLEL